MKNNISQFTKNAVIEYRKLDNTKKLYVIAIILSHAEKGLINNGNYVNSEEAYENDLLVFEPGEVELDDPVKLATNLLVIGATKEDVTINPNGIDIEPYIKDMKSIEPILSKFYKLNMCDKIDFIIEVLYDISIIEEVEQLDFDFNGLISNLLTYHRDNFGDCTLNSIEVE